MRETTIDIRSGQRGDFIVISAHHSGEHEQLGEILEVLGEAEHTHYRVRWEDDTESIFYPGNDASIRQSHTRMSR